jgi:outer membrane immunogenic protein
LEEGDMKRLLIAGAALAALIGTPALAADLARPVYKAPPAPLPPPCVWCGWYIGLNAGYAWGTSDTATVSPGLPFSAPPANVIYSAAESPSVRSNGFTGGAQIGYNMQINSFVFGAEADFEDFSLRGSANTTVTPPGNVQVLSQTNIKTDWLFTARPRLGFAADQWLVYATGGLAVADIKYSQTNTYVGLAPSEVGTISTTKAGWTVGGGVEVKIAPMWSVKAEYLYVDFGNTSTTLVNPITPTTTFSHATDLKASIARAGVNYHF